ncbi:major head protein [Enterobacter phage Arya]|uniref:Putative major capsid protein n=1 Tax=Enterobacter phage Arya TaxID=1864622 RepID=A0A193GYA3_9CAUD|nr:major head protein [Enterobacter phage Arya]ANN86113.1 putative major capsid protein [Enterobacter phage Arya]
MGKPMNKNRLSSIIGTYYTREAGSKPLPDFNKGGLVRTMEVRSIDTAARTVELAFSSEIEVERWYGIEILDHDPASVRLDRLRDGGALLVDHDWTDQVGVIESVTIDADRRGRAVVRFGRSARADEIFNDIVDGIRKHVSVGYRVLAAKLTETRDEWQDVYRITDWEPYEISIVSVPADNSVGIGRALDTPHEEQRAEKPNTSQSTKPVSEDSRMEKILRDASGNLVRALVDEKGNITQVLEVLERAGDDARNAEKRGREAEQARVRSITEMGEKYNARDLALKAIGDNTSAEEFQRSLLDHLNKPKDPAQPAERSGSRPLSEMPSSVIGMDEKDIRRYSIFNVVRALANPNDAAAQRAAAFEIECSNMAQKQYGRNAKGILIPDDVLRAFNAGGAPNTPAGAQTGSNMVGTDFMAGSFIDLLRPRTTIMRLARTMGGLVGNVEIPKQTGGATAYWIGEGDDANETTPTIGQLGLSPKTVAAYTDITRRLLMQSTPDAEAIVRGDLVAAIAQAIDYAGYYGTGTSNQPLGLANYTGINAVDFAGANPTYAELVQMETEIAADNADVNSMAYVLNARGRGAAKTTPKFASGASVSDAGVIWEPGNTINGYRAEVTNQVQDGDVFFGNFADLVVGMWGGLDMTVDPYSLSKSGGLRIVVFQDVDFAVRRVESFALGRNS